MSDQSATESRAGEFARRTLYEATVKTLSQGLTMDQIAPLVESALSFTTKAMDGVEQQSGPLACEAGCHFCCYLMATVSSPEALAIGQRLVETASQERLKEIKQKVAQAYRQTEVMDNVARIRAGVPCPFLTAAGLCSIYTYRPLDCVTYHSLSRRACEEMLAEPERGHPTHGALQAVSAGVKTGLGQGIAEVNLEQPALRYELIEAIHIYLNEERAMEKYLGGKNIFMPAAIIIDSGSGLSYKIKHAPPHLKARAKRIIASERRRARQARRKK